MDIIIAGSGKVGLTLARGISLSGAVLERHLVQTVISRGQSYGLPALHV